MPLISLQGSTSVDHYPNRRLHRQRKTVPLRVGLRSAGFFRLALLTFDWFLEMRIRRPNHRTNLTTITYSPTLSTQRLTSRSYIHFSSICSTAYDRFFFPDFRFLPLLVSRAVQVLPNADVERAP